MASIPVKTREEWRDYWLLCFSNRNPDADVGPGSYPWLRASVQADVLTLMSGAALAIADSIPLDNMTGTQLDAKYGSKLPRNPETNASGSITLQCGTAGTTIQIGDLLSHASTKNTYKVNSVTALYTNGTQLAIESVDPGLGQNLASGEILQWVSPRPGCYATAAVFQSPDGEGLIGGRAVENDDSYRERIRAFNANPIGHGNEGDLAALVESTREHGVPVEKCFTYPAWHGPGTVAYSFTVKRDNPWESRLPSSGQISDVLTYVTSKLPGDFSITPLPVSYLLRDVDLAVTLDNRLDTWTDFEPWPAYTGSRATCYNIGTVTSSTRFEIVDPTSAYTYPPSPGATVGVFDAGTLVFRRKKILTVTGVGPWAIVCDTTSEQSDTSYAPITGQLLSPWFDSINLCATELAKHFAGLGPGEVASGANRTEDGTRMARQPRPFRKQWDYAITTQAAFDVWSGVDSVVSCSIKADSLFSPDTSSDVIMYLHDAAIFKE